MDCHLRRYASPFLVAAVFLMVAAPAAAQGFGIGGRLAWIKNDSALDVDSERFFGGQIRLSGARIGVEVSLDRHSTSLELLNQKVTETPIQVSLLLKLSSSSFQPYLLGGPGWYYRSVSPIDGAGDDLEVSTHDFGWHGGIGAEIRAGRHFGIHGDYRYTFLDFNDDDDEEIGGGILGSILPGHKGSMITLGATVYF
jgi:Outer membrane protein beta-barrel domain